MPIATSSEHGSLTQLTSPIGVTLEKKDAAGQSQRTGVLLGQYRANGWYS